MSEWYETVEETETIPVLYFQLQGEAIRWTAYIVTMLAIKAWLKRG